MAASFDWLGVAEASASDARGALTLIGVGQNVVTATQFPHREQRVLVVTVLDDDGTELGKRPDAPIGMSLSFTAPSGKVLLVNNQTFTVGQAINPAGVPPNIPARGFQLVMGLNLEVTEYGPHKISVDINLPEHEPLSRVRNIYVVPPPDVLVAEAG